MLSGEDNDYLHYGANVNHGPVSNAIEDDTQMERLYELEVELQQVRDELEAERLKSQTADGHVRDVERQLYTLQLDIQRLEDDLQKSHEVNATTNESLARIEEEKNDLQKEVEQLRKLEPLIADCKELEAGLLEARDVILEKEHDVSVAEREIQRLSALVSSLQQHKEESTLNINELKRELSEALKQLSELGPQYEQLVAANETLISRLETLDPSYSKSECAPVEKTLFADVEDRRQELENQHNSLQDKHVGLMRAHAIAVHQTERMRGHISRLTQLSTVRDLDTHVRSLERDLAAAEAEKMQYIHQVQVLESKLRKARKRTIITSSSGISKKLRSEHTDMQVERGESLEDEPDKPADDEASGSMVVGDESVVVECLRLEIRTLENDVETYRNELETLRVLLSNEHDKTRTMESKLGAAQDEIWKLKNTVAKLTFATVFLKGEDISDDTTAEPNSKLGNDLAIVDDVKENIDTNVEVSREISLKTAATFLGRVSNASMYSQAVNNSRRASSDNIAALETADDENTQPSICVKSDTNDTVESYGQPDNSAVVNMVHSNSVPSLGNLNASAGMMSKASALRERAEPTHVTINRDRIHNQDDCRQQ